MGRTGLTRLLHKARALNRSKSHNNEAIFGVLGGGFELILGHAWLIHSFTNAQLIDNFTSFAGQEKSFGKHGCPQSTFKTRRLGLTGRKEVHLEVFGKMLNKLFLKIACYDNI